MARIHVRKFTTAIAMLAVTAGVAASAMFGTGVAAAQVDNVTTIVTPDGMTIEAEIAWTNIQFVPPLDSNPASREWFHDSVVGYRISGPGADKFKGKVTVGYHVGYPYSLGSVGVKVDQPAIGDFEQLGGAYTFGFGFGPGIADVPVGSVETSGASDQFAIHGWHGTVTGVIGQIHIRPYFRVTSEHGDTVTAYGKIWDH
jgi:hypothetical protein